MNVILPTLDMEVAFLSLKEYSFGKQFFLLCSQRILKVFASSYNSDRRQTVHLTLCFTKFFTSVLKLSATMNRVDIMFPDCDWYSL